MSQPCADCVQIHAGSQKMGRGRVPERVRSDPLGCHGRNLLGRLPRTPADQLTNPRPSERSAPAVQEHRIVRRLPPDQCRKRLRRAVQQRAEACPATLAPQRYDRMSRCSVDQLQVRDYQSGSFRDPGARAVEKLQQGAFATPLRRVIARRVQQGVHFVLL